tara:strand:+ start:148 stop:342 length:195 start_codon:yes stop_codon:yes gene_type:complete
MPHSQVDLADTTIADALNNLIKILVNGYITAVTDSLELNNPDYIILISLYPLQVNKFIFELHKV